MLGCPAMQYDDLEVLLRSRIPLIAVESRDESEVLKALTRACARLPCGGSPANAMTGAGTAGGLPVFQWTVTDGLKRLDLDTGTPQRTLTEPIEILKHMRATTLVGAYALLDFHPYLVIRPGALLKDIAQDYDHCARTSCLISYRDGYSARGSST